MAFSSSFPGEAVTLASLLPLDDYRQFQDCLLRIAELLQIPLERIQDSTYELLDILQIAGPNKEILYISEAIMEPANRIQHIPATCAPTLKEVERKYFAPYNRTEYLFSHPAPNSLVVQVVTKLNRLHHLKSTPSDKDAKRQDLFRWKNFSASLQFHCCYALFST